jgi:hypothetical protein
MNTILENTADVTSVLDMESILNENAEAVWAWVSEQRYAALVAANRGDLLVRVGERFTFGEIEAACKGYRRYAGGRGQEEQHPVGRLCRALVVKWLKGWSYRQTCAEVATNDLVRWFVGYPLHGTALCYVTLQRFEAWVNEHHPRLFFNTLLRQIDEDFAPTAPQPQVGDTFALQANVAEQSRTHLLRSACQRLVKAWNQLCPATPLPGLTPALRQALWGSEGERPEYALDKAARDTRECQTALAAYTLLELAQAAQAQLPPGHSLLYAVYLRWLGLLHKLLGDEFVCQRSEGGDPLSVRHATEKERGSFVLGSSVDPDATFRKHGERVDLGYNIHLTASATTGLVREIFATTGATPDAAGVPLLIAHQHEQGFALPPKLIYDRAAGSPKTIHLVDRASEGQTQLVAALIDHSKHKGRFGPLDFTLNDDGSLTCPNGQTTAKAYRAGGGDGWNYRFSAQQCHACPLWDGCRGPHPERLPTPTPAGDSAPPKQKRRHPKPTSYRQVFISNYRTQQRQAILYTQSQAFKADMKLRPAIERIIAALVRYNGARRARSVGLTNADVQVRMAALAYNLKRWHVLTMEQEKAQRVRKAHNPPEDDSG